MKNHFYLKLSLFIVFAVIVVMSLNYCYSSIGSTADSTTTIVKVKNTNANDTVLVYLTIGDGSGYVTDVNGVFGIKSSNKLQGSFYLNPGDSVSYVCPKDKGISGNISFWNPPVNCPYPGITLYEFTINNKGTVVNAQETVDISCVAGVTSIGIIELSGGGNWTDNHGNDSVTFFQNNTLGGNTNISGVFPYGCTNCVNQGGAPDCTGHPPYSTPCTKNICNVQRNANNSGGTVTISYISK